MEFNEDQINEQLLSVLGEEEFEQLDELSKKTLGSYIKKANQIGSMHARNAGHERMAGVDAGKNGDYETMDKHYDRAAKNTALQVKRQRGVAKAVDKLTKEDIEQHLEEVFGEEFEQLDELSKKTLGSYIMKSARSYANHEVDKAKHQRSADDINRMKHASPEHVKKALGSAEDESRSAAYKSAQGSNKRAIGMIRATKRLTKESVESMIAAAYESKPVEFAAAFGSAMHEVIMDKMDQMRPDVAARMFEPKE